MCISDSVAKEGRSDIHATARVGSSTQPLSLPLLLCWPNAGATVRLTRVHRHGTLLGTLLHSKVLEGSGTNQGWPYTPTCITTHRSRARIRKTNHHPVPKISRTFANLLELLRSLVEGIINIREHKSYTKRLHGYICLLNRKSSNRRQAD